MPFSLPETLVAALLEQPLSAHLDFAATGRADVDSARAELTIAWMTSVAGIVTAKLDPAAPLPLPLSDAIDGFDPG